ncbi:glycosyltransferase [Williamsia serinedens]|uniref:glycosyltransferase n=1 Tax=Williamsia serinedens TaxID=391736 RepID=UPI0020A5EF72|nr:glycosyltransferase [Williamsia serinedens]
MVTLVSPDGAFGGPVRVALNLAVGLQESGHDVVIAGACRGFDKRPEHLDGVSAKLFKAVHFSPGISFAGVSAPGLMRWLHRNLVTFDVVHVHLGRDLVTLPTARMALKRGVPLIAQTHGMIVPIANPIARFLDVVSVKDTLRRASTVLHLSAEESAELRQLTPLTNLCELPNGVPTAAFDDVERADPPEIIFMARVHPRKRPELFVRAAIELIREGSRARFTIVGPDGGAFGAVERLIDESPLTSAQRSALVVEPALDHDAALRRLAAARAFVLPSYREPFAMTILEAMSVGTPVIVGQGGGLSSFVDTSGAGMVVDGSVDQLVEAMRVLISRGEDAQRMGEAGRAAVHETYGMSSVVSRVQRIYDDALERR